jgi:hypothetical protein
LCKWIILYHLKQKENLRHTKRIPQEKDNLKKMPDTEEVARELGKAKSSDDFARQFIHSPEQIVGVGYVEIEKGYAGKKRQTAHAPMPGCGGPGCR